MADLPAAQSTRDSSATSDIASADPPQFVLRLTLWYLRTLLLILPVSLLSGVVTFVALWMIFDELPRQLLKGRTIAVGELLALFGGVSSGAVTFFYFAMQFDFEYARFRLGGALENRRELKCPACQTTLTLGQVVCAGCGTDLRAASRSNQPSVGLRRFALACFALATVPLANVTFLGLHLASVFARYVLEDLGRVVSEATALGLLACAYLVAGGLIAMRMRHVVALWSLLNAEDLEFGVPPQR